MQNSERQDMLTWTAQVERLNRLSELIFGEPEEIDVAEAEQLLRAAGIDPAEFKRRVISRLEQTRCAKTGEGGRS